MPRTVRLLCSSPVVRDGMARLLHDGGWDVADADSPDVCEVTMVVVRTSVGVAEVREAWRASPDRPVVALTDDSDFDLVAETLRAGATSVISWDRDVRVLLSAMELAAEGLSSIETPMLGQLVSHAANPSTITDAECSWLGHLDRGLTIAELAPLAGYSERSLYRQLNGLYHRLGVHDRGGAIAEARRRGLL